jgi:hypothetical protein
MINFFYAIVTDPSTKVPEKGKIIPNFPHGRPEIWVREAGGRSFIHGRFLDIASESNYYEKEHNKDDRAGAVYEYGHHVLYGLRGASLLSRT